MRVGPDWFGARPRAMRRGARVPSRATTYGLQPPPTLPSWVPAAGGVSTFTQGGGVLTNNFRAVFDPIGEPGAWLLPQDVSDEYAKQVVSESRITLPNGRRVWKQHAPDNHYLDAEVLATAGAHMLQIHRMRALRAAEDAPAPEPPRVEKFNPPPESKARVTPPRPGGFVKGWRT